jgi:hypothetical protein
VEAGLNSHIRLYADTGQNLEEGIATKGIHVYTKAGLQTGLF